MTIERTTDRGLRPNVLHDQTVPNRLGGLSQDPLQRSERPVPLAAIAVASVVALALASILVRAM
jgi:hypothetical protein